MKDAQKLFLLCLVGAIIVLVALASAQAQAAKWPAIQPLRQTRMFTNLAQTKADTPFRVAIRDEAGTVVYRLECHSANYNDPSEINFSSDFQCALFAMNGSATLPANLLVANTPDERSTDWWNRGRLLSKQLRGSCLNYPEYSSDRHFKFRGMRITLSFTDFKWSARHDQQDSPLLDGFKLAVDVVSDPTAQSATAEVPTGPRPPRACYP